MSSKRIQTDLVIEESLQSKDTKVEDPTKEPMFSLTEVKLQLSQVSYHLFL